MRDINGNNNGIVNDNSKTMVAGDNTGIINVYSDDYFSGKKNNPKIEKEKVSLKKIIKEKVIEAIIGVVLTLIAKILDIVKENEVIPINKDVFLLIIMMIFYVVGIIMLVIFLYDIIHILKLKRNGQFVEFESKTNWVNMVISIFSSSNKKQENTRNVGKCYKNINGNIYRIKGAKCPLCETEPIGNMYLLYSNNVHTYFWKCSENPSHKIKFDFKKNF